MQLYLPCETVLDKRLVFDPGRMVKQGNGATDGTCINNCSSASLSSSGSCCNRSAHVFFVIALQEPDVDSFMHVISSKLMCWYREN